MFKYMYQTDSNVLNFEIISLLGVQPITCSQQTRLRQTLPITKNDYFISEIDISSSECNIYIHFKQTKLKTKIFKKIYAITINLFDDSQGSNFA